MALEIYWSRRATESFLEIINYLLENWGNKSVKKFIIEIDSFFNVILTNPEIGKIIVREEYIRSIAIGKHVTLIYKLQDDEIILLNIFNNRQQPSKRFK
jgi:plasmid stabilization system protein ParE